MLLKNHQKLLLNWKSGQLGNVVKNVIINYFLSNFRKTDKLATLLKYQY